VQLLCNKQAIRGNNSSISGLAARHGSRGPRCVSSSDNCSHQERVATRCAELIERSDTADKPNLFCGPQEPRPVYDEPVPSASLCLLSGRGHRPQLTDQTPQRWSIPAACFPRPSGHRSGRVSPTEPSWPRHLKGAFIAGQVDCAHGEEICNGARPLITPLVAPAPETITDCARSEALVP
jgi:hypothetical protein